MENEQKNINIQSEQNMIQTEDDTTFNKLKDLQKLLKKESAVKELFIKMKNETKLSIEHQCIDVYKKKMEESFKIDEVVWVKLKGYPWWPGIVRR